MRNQAYVENVENAFGGLADMGRKLSKLVECRIFKPTRGRRQAADQKLRKTAQSGDVTEGEVDSIIVEVVGDACSTRGERG